MDQEHANPPLSPAGPPPGGTVHTVSLEKHVLPHLATAARTLAIKGFSPDEAALHENSCSLTVRGRTAGLEGQIQFEHPDTRSGGGIPWNYIITSGHLPRTAEKGIARDENQIRDVTAAFVSVFTTVASFAAA